MRCPPALLALPSSRGRAQGVDVLNKHSSELRVEMLTQITPLRSSHLFLFVGLRLYNILFRSTGFTTKSTSLKVLEINDNF